MVGSHSYDPDHVSRSYIQRCMEEPDSITFACASVVAIAHYVLACSDYSWVVKLCIGSPFAFVLVMLSTDFALNVVFRSPRWNYYGGYVSSIMLGVPCTELQRAGSSKIKEQWTLVVLAVLVMLYYNGPWFIVYVYATMAFASLYISHTLPAPAFAQKRLPVPWHRQRLARRFLTAL